MPDNDTGSHIPGKDPGDLAAEFAALRDDVNAILKTLREASSEVAGDAKSAAGHAAKGIKRAATDRYEDVKERAESLEEDLVASVKDSPLQAVAIAFGAGFLLSLMMRR